MGDKGQIYEKGWDGEYHPAEGFTGPKEGEVKRGVLTGEPVPARDSFGNQKRASDGTPLFESAGRGGGGEAMLAGLVAAVVVVAVVIAFVIIAAALVAIVALIVWWSRGLARSIRRDRATGVHMSSRTLAWAVSGGVAALLVAAVGVSQYRPPSRPPAVAGVSAASRQPAGTPSVTSSRAPAADVTKGTAVPLPDLPSVAAVQNAISVYDGGSALTFSKLQAWGPDATSQLRVCATYSGGPSGKTTKGFGMGPDGKLGWLAPNIFYSTPGQTWSQCAPYGSYAGAAAKLTGAPAADVTKGTAVPLPDLPSVAAVQNAISVYDGGSALTFSKLQAWGPDATSQLRVCATYSGGPSGKTTKGFGMGPDGKLGWLAPNIFYSTPGQTWSQCAPYGSYAGAAAKLPK